MNPSTSKSLIRQHDSDSGLLDARPALGPANPFVPQNVVKKNVPTGRAQEVFLSDSTFATHHRTFQSLGYAQNPSANGKFVGNQEAARLMDGKNIIQKRPNREESKAIRAKRHKQGDPSVLEGADTYLGPWARYKDDDVDEEAEELASDEEYEEEVVAPASNPIIDKAGAGYLDINTGVEETQFHGAEQFDYQGRTYMHVPQDLGIDLRKELGSIQNYVPKTNIHTWKSHTKAITSLRFFPSSGHVLLSASADSKIKLWDVYHSRELLRTFSGHSKAISDITFHPSGKHFLSASYDRQMKLWDTEYGKCISRFTTGKIPHVIRFHPSAPNDHEFLAGMSDKKIVQFDTRSGQLVQEYDHHLGAVNTITFIDQDRRFITTSDDQSLRAWEYGIPVPVKLIAEPHMFSMVRSAPHPSGKYVAFQSLDNQIVVYSSNDRIRQNQRKVFKGHNNAGYAIDLAVSFDGKIMMSGDSGGYVCFWNWNTCEPLAKLKASDGPVLSAQWHPQETSKVATGGLDGVIKYWD
ncbi:MAG: hypothetical protein M1829_001272 [Trizodia sp. TS-e1964]|nr:MAG: hypothetical protein M1829_001272 [Trizodia sp. TS-e1964]